MGTREVRIIRYADNTTLIADNENNLQRLLFGFRKTCRQFGLEIATSKTTTLTISKEPLTCKLKHQGQVMEQILFFKYLEVTVTSSGILAREVYSG